MHRKRAPILLAILSLLPVAASTGCSGILGIRSASQSEKAKIRQLVGPLDQRAVSAASALQAIIEAAPRPVTIRVCASLAEAPVTVVTTEPEELGALLQSVAFQLGASIRFFVGQHGEVAQPTLWCSSGDAPLLTISVSRGRIAAVEQRVEADGALSAARASLEAALRARSRSHRAAA